MNSFLYGNRNESKESFEGCFIVYFLKRFHWFVKLFENGELMGDGEIISCLHIVGDGG